LSSSRAPGLRIGIVAGETSGDLLGAGLMRALIDGLGEDIEFEGIGGPEMQKLGCKSLFPMESVTLVGLDGLLRRLREILGIRKALVNHFTARPPDLFIGVDLPDFNIGLEGKLRAKGIPTLQYVSPTVWAWRQYRIHKIKRSVSHMLVLFPFEQDFYRQHGVPVSFAGHPVANEFPDIIDVEKYRTLFGIAGQQRVVALLPGSRSGEISRLSALMIDTAVLLKSRYPELVFLAPMVNESAKKLFQQALQQRPQGADLIRLVDGQSREVMSAADVVVLASGTATMEAALLKKPMVVTYKVSRLTALYVNFLLKQKMVAMPNYLLGEKVVPEFLQDDATAENICGAVQDYLDQPRKMQSLKQRFMEMHQSLKGQGEKVMVQAVQSLIGHGHA